MWALPDNAFGIGACSRGAGGLHSERGAKAVGDRVGRSWLPGWGEKMPGEELLLGIGVLFSRGLDELAASCWGLKAVGGLCGTFLASRLGEMIPGVGLRD